jgi:hypothetical protein
MPKPCCAINIRQTPYDDKLDKFIGVVTYDLSLQPKINPKDLKVEGNIQGVFYHGDR